MIDGHARHDIYGDDASVPIIITDFTTEEAEAFLLTFDPVGDLAGADLDKLNDLIEAASGMLDDPAIELMLADLTEKHEAEAVDGEGEDEGGVHNGLSERTTDLYSTPESAIAMLLKHVQLPKRIWEPAAGKFAISNYLQECGFEVNSTSLETGENFLEHKPRFRWDAIVTNPPFSIKNDFIERCVHWKKPFYLLMPLAALEGARRQAVWEKCSLTIVIPNYRIDYIRFDGEHTNPNMSSAWFCVDPKGEVGTKVVYAGSLPEG